MPSYRYVMVAALLLLAAPPVAWAAMSARDRADILAPATNFSEPEQFEALAGGTATNRRRLDREAYSQPSASLDFSERGEFFVGNGLFKRLWVTAPSSTQAADGLGPLYNARACQRCHLKDGRGHPPEGPADSAVSMFLRLSVPPQNDADRALLESGQANIIPEPTYGGQLQDLAVADIPPEGRMTIHYNEVPVTLGDGTVVSLRQPTYGVADLGYGPLHKETMLSPRVAPPMIGLGLLEAIAAEDLHRLLVEGAITEVRHTIGRLAQR
ncbi:MAG: di-heme oxidoredictase family protein, partial [Pseudomonadota bacterium]